MSMVHDNEVLSYFVDLRNDQIRIQTIYEGKEQVEETEIVFNNVLAHFFEHHLKGSIIFDICESEISSFIKGNLDLLIKNKCYCWPMDFNSIDELEIELKKEGYKYINLMSSYGMNGWVLAKDYELVIREVLK